MKQKNFLKIIFCFLLISNFSYGQNWTEDFESTPSTSYGDADITISGRVWTKNQAGNFNYANTSAGSDGFTINDDKPNAHITTPSLNTCGTVSFKYAYINGSSSNVFQFQVSTDGTNFTTLDTHTLGTSANQTYTNYTYDVNNLSSTVFIRILSDDQDAHLFIDDFSVTNYSPGSPNITISTTSLTGLDYEFGSGPSSELTFTAEGNDLTANIILTAPSNFEFSTTSGSDFDSSIILAQDEGAVASTTIYIRLESDLAINTYTGDITASSTGAASKTISLSGEVTAASCAGTSTSFPFNGVSGSTNLDHDSSGSNPSGSSGESCGTNYRIFYEEAPSSDGSGNYIKSNASDDLIESADWGGEGEFETFAIDVSGETSIDIETFGATVNGGFNANSEQFQWWYKLDSGSETNLGAAFGAGTSYTGSLAIGPTTIDVTGVNAIIVGFTFDMNGGSDGFEDVNLTVTTTSIPATSTWDGSESNDWATAGNWSNGVPAASTDVTIPAGLTNYPTVTTAVTINSVTINSGASLIAQSTFSGNVTYNRNLGTENWYLVSSPVAGETYDDAYVAANSLAINGTNNAIASYVPSDDEWSYMQTVDAAANFTAGQGYSVRRETGESAGDISFTGTINTASVETSSLAAGFNLLGNPFTSFVNSATFLGAATSSNIDQTQIWLWNQATGMYEVKTSGEAWALAPGQGFFVNATSAGTVTFDESNQAATGNVFQRSAKTEVKLVLSDGENNRFAKLNFGDNFSKGFDFGWEGETFGGIPNSLSIFTSLLDDNVGKKYQLQSLPNSDYENMIVPIGLIADAGKEITFSAEALNLPSGLKVFLEDRFTNTFTRLDETNSTYTLALTEKLNGVGRFYLHTNSSALNIDEVQMENISMYKSNASTLIIIGLPQGKASIKLFNILGKEVLNTSFTSNGIKNISLPKLAKGIYIVQLQAETGKLNKKIILE